MSTEHVISRSNWPASLTYSLGLFLVSDIFQSFRNLFVSCDIHHAILAFRALLTCNVNKSSFIKKGANCVLEKQLKAEHGELVLFQKEKNYHYYPFAAINPPFPQLSFSS